MYDQGLVWRDGELIPFEDATCHVLSHMAARGSQVFDVMLVASTDGGPCGIGLRAHVARFLRSAEMMGMTEVGEVGDIERAIAKTVLANADRIELDRPGRSAMVKIVAAWTEEGIGVMPASLRPSVYVLVIGAGDRVPLPEPGASVRSAMMPKLPPEFLPPSLKVAAGYTPGVREQLKSRAEGFDQTVFKTSDGDLAESTTLSVLVVAGGRILAPPLDTVLDGITRRVVLDVAQDAGLPVEVRSIRWSEVLAADELILSSTSHPVLPVARLDDLILPTPGPVAAALGAGVDQLYAGRHRLADRWLTGLQAIT